MTRQTICKLFEMMMARGGGQPLLGHGLVDGNMGMAVVLYEYARYSGDTRAEKMAEGLLDNIFSAPPSDVSLAQGVAGIGIGVNHLLRNGFIEGSGDEILSDIDDMVFKCVADNDRMPLDLMTGKTGYLLYYYLRATAPASGRARKRISGEMIKYLVNHLSNDLQAEFAYLTQDIRFELFATVPCAVHLLCKIYEAGIYREKIRNTLREWSQVMVTCVPNLQYGRMNLILSLSKINEILASPAISDIMEMLLSSLDEEKMKEETDLYDFSSISSGLSGQYLLTTKLIEVLQKTGRDLLFLPQIKSFQRYYLDYQLARWIQGKMEEQYDILEDHSLTSGFLGMVLMLMREKK